MTDDHLNRLDDRTAERLLQGEPGAAGTGELQLLSALLEAAAAPAAAADSLPTAEEEAAVAAFRIGRESGARPRRVWLRRPLRAAAGVLAAVTLFGGVAVAVQAGAIRLPHSPGRRQTPGAAQSPVAAPAPATASTLPGLPPGGTGYSGSPAAGRPAGPPSPSSAADQGAAQSLRSLCTAYQTAQQAHGTVHSAEALQRLAQAAGSEAAIADYCAGLLGTGSGAAAHGGSASNGSGAGKAPTGAASPSKGPR